ncbi:hypothetical protein ACFV1W_39125 [Kitasatospora sp. NPDC059648]|uniref:hypothetical protein n=1 Tax=Kitasatospora sp. NPDC059648 TaxID=3346894 RepID=UPI0036928999
MEWLRPLVVDTGILPAVSCLLHSVLGLSRRSLGAAARTAGGVAPSAFVHAG